MDRIDVLLLEALQQDSSRSIADLAEVCGISSSACHRRVKSMEEAKLICGYAARIDPRRVGLRLLAFVEISLTSQSRDAMERFECEVQSYRDVLDCYLMSGQSDYLLRVAVSDLDQFDMIHRSCLSRLPGVSSMKTSFAIRQVKEFSGYVVRQK